MKEEYFLTVINEPLLLKYYWDLYKSYENLENLDFRNYCIKKIKDRRHLNVKVQTERKRYRTQTSKTGRYN